MLMRVLAALLAFFTTAVAGSADPQARNRHKWWQDEKVKLELALTEQQSADVEATFQASLPKLRDYKRELEALEEELSKTIRERTAAEAVVAQLIDRVEAARSELSKERTLMLYRIHGILTPEQNVRLKEMNERRARERDNRERRP